MLIPFSHVIRPVYRWTVLQCMTRVVKNSNSRVVRKKNSERHKKNIPPSCKLNGRSLIASLKIFKLSIQNSIIYKEITCQDDCKKLQSDLDAAARWEADWLMAFHTDKCTVLTITQKKTPFKHDYILHNHIFEPVTSAKYLGVTLQSNLKWNTHIDNITSNGNKSLRYLKRNVQISNPEVKLV